MNENGIRETNKIRLKCEKKKNDIRIKNVDRDFFEIRIKTRIAIFPFFPDSNKKRGSRFFRLVVNSRRVYDGEGEGEGEVL